MLSQIKETDGSASLPHLEPSLLSFFALLIPSLLYFFALLIPSLIKGNLRFNFVSAFFCFAYTFSFFCLFEPLEIPKIRKYTISIFTINCYSKRQIPKTKEYIVCHQHCRIEIIFYFGYHCYQ